MKAAVFNQLNEYPEITQLDQPKVNSDHTLIKVKSAALNRRDYWITKGMYPDIKMPVILGSDLCGFVEGTGDVIVDPGMDWGNSPAVQSDDFHVLGMPSNGGFAEYCSVPSCNVYERPSHLDQHQAAALPLGGVTAYRAMFTRGGLTDKDTVLITGAGGGVSSFCILFAVAIGARVIVTSSNPSKIDKAIALGAEKGYLYTEEGYEKTLLKETGGVDLIIDSAGGAHLSRLMKCVNPGGRISFYGGTNGKIPSINPQLIFWRQMSILGSTMGSPSDFVAMLELVNKYQIVPVVDTVFSLDAIGQAFSLMENSDQFGKIVIEISS